MLDLSFTLLNLNKTKLKEILQLNDKEFIDVLLPYIEDEDSQVSKAAISCLRIPLDIHQLISLFLSMTTVAHADLETKKFGLVYAASITTSNLSEDEIEERKDDIHKLNTMAKSLATLFTVVNSTLQGVPLVLSNSSFNAAKSLILGTF